MGIPSFYRWLVDRYPRSVADVVEETPLIENDRPVPVDASLPNPNGYEFDNLYLDMNGIIHPCFHPEGLPPPSDYDEVFQAVFMYIDRVFNIVRPRQLLYLAIDGVAPRAKMNQQRSRRFRTAKEMEDEIQASLKTERHESGENELPVTGQSKKLDSNVITPGTVFMELLSSALRYYINLRMNEEVGWKGIKVILSDASVPGEGEHKIMSYIRLQRNLPGFNPNTRHCLYGLDADLIMLALATHEIHFSVLREDVRKNKVRSNVTTNGNDCGSVLTKSGISQQSPAFLDNFAHFISKIKFQFLNVWTLREYLMYDLRIPDSTLETDMERLIDDFVFMCLLVGNDFLPHIPSLVISEGAIDLLMMLYKKEFVRMGGYLTDSFKMNLAHVEHFIQAVGSYESKIFRKRIQTKKGEWGSNISSQHRLEIEHLDRLANDRNLSEPQDKGKTVAAQGPVNGLGINSAAEADEVKLGEDGWKERYYVQKFQLNSEDECQRIQRQVVTKYIEGLSWVMHYYYEGVCSWQWFYPFYYAPFASDFHGFDNLEVKFTLGKPFKPFDQLLGVLPAASADALPLSYGKLMKDDLSPIADFYPANFEVDMNGKRFSWQGICKLPFIDEARLLSEIAKVEQTLTDEEKRRNSLGWDILFVHKSNALAAAILSFSDKCSHQELLDMKAELEINPITSGGMNGYICVDQNPVWPSEICSPIDCWPAIANIGVIAVFYKYPPSHPHIPNLPEGVILPDKSVSKKDIVPPQLSAYDGVSFLLCSRKLMPNSVSGPNLSRLARQLVLLHITKADCNTVKEFPVLKEQKQCSDIQGKTMGSGTTISSFGKFDNASELVVAHNDCALTGTPKKTNIVELINKKLDICKSLQKLESKKLDLYNRIKKLESEKPKVQFGDIHAAASKVVGVEAEAEPRSKKKRSGSKKRKCVEEVNNEETTEILEISDMKARAAACPLDEESEDVSRVGKSDKVRILEGMSDADVNSNVLDVSVTPGIIGGRKRKRYHAPGLECSDVADKAGEAIEPTSGKTTVYREETDNSRGKLEESSVITREDTKEAGVEKQMETRSADVDISESCSSAFTTPNKSGSCIMMEETENPKESSNGIHVGADIVMETVAEMKPSDKKRKKSKKQRIVEVGASENTTGI